MAEIAVSIGVAAAAAQFTSIACSILLHASRLSSRLQDIPQCLQRTLDQLRLLLHLADLVSKKEMAQVLPGVVSLSSTCPPSTRPSSVSWLESVWKDCTAQAQSLEKIILSMLCETEDSYAQKIWKKILTIKREEKILQIVDNIERYKSMLNLWFGQECLDNIHFMRQKILDVHVSQMTHLVSASAIFQSDTD